MSKANGGTLRPLSRRRRQRPYASAPNLEAMHSHTRLYAPHSQDLHSHRSSTNNLARSKALNTDQEMPPAAMSGVQLASKNTRPPCAASSKSTVPRHRRASRMCRNGTLARPLKPAAALGVEASGSHAMTAGCRWDPLCSNVPPCTAAAAAAPSLHTVDLPHSPLRPRVSHTSRRISWGCAARSPSTTNSSCRRAAGDGDVTAVQCGTRAAETSKFCEVTRQAAHMLAKQQLACCALRMRTNNKLATQRAATCLLVQCDLPRAALALDAARLLLDARQPGPHLGSER